MRAGVFLKIYTVLEWRVFVRLYRVANLLEEFPIEHTTLKQEL